MPNEIKFDMSSAIDKAKQEAQSVFERQVENAALSVARRLFNDGRYNGPEGLAHEIIRKKIEEMVLSDEFTQRIERIANEVMDEQIASALKLLLHANTRKRVFTAVENISQE